MSEGPGSYSHGGFGRGGKRGGGGGFRRNDREDKVHDSIIEERIQRERPCRTLFIRNIKASALFNGDICVAPEQYPCAWNLKLTVHEQYETNSEDVRRMFEEHGEIRTFFDLIANRGMVFVTYVSAVDQCKYHTAHPLLPLV